MISKAFFHAFRLAGLSLVAACGALAQSGASLQVRNENGRAAVVFHGREVWSGPTTGTATARSQNINGTEHAAVFDGTRLLWENVPGAGGQIAPATPAAGGADIQKLLQEHQRLVEEQRRQMEAHQRALQQALNQKTGSGTTTGSRGGGGSSGSGVSSGSSSGSGSGSGSGTASGSGEVTLSSGDATVRRSQGETTLTWQGRTIPLGKTSGPLSLRHNRRDDAQTLTVLEGDRILWEGSRSSGR